MVTRIKITIFIEHTASRDNGAANKTVSEGGYGVIGDEFMARGNVREGMTDDKLGKTTRGKEPDAGWEKWDSYAKDGTFTVRRDYDAAETNGLWVRTWTY